MSTLSSMLAAAARAVAAALSPRRPPRSGGRGRAGAPLRAGRPPGPAPRKPPVAPDDAEPGRFGPDATVEVAPRSVGPVRMTYHPSTDGDPDPGEIVWTWVPFEENDGRGKDRPVLVVAAEPAGTVLAVQLTSRDHTGEVGFVPVGAGTWDGEHRASWVNIDRVLRVRPSGMRREAAALDAAHYGRVEAALRERYGWR